MRWLFMCIAVVLTFVCFLSPPVSASPVDDCQDALTLIDTYSGWLCQCYLDLSIKEGEVCDRQDDYQQAVQARQDLAAQIIALIELPELTAEQADELCQLLLQQTPMDNAIKDAEAALKKAQDEMQKLKDQLVVLNNLRTWKQKWYDEHCLPAEPNPNPVPDPAFP